MPDVTSTYLPERNRYVIVAADSAMSHECTARDGGRVDLPVYFDSGGYFTLCPFCCQSV